MIAIVYDSQQVVTKLTTLAGQLEKPEGLAKAVGREGVEQLRDHFLDRDQYPNRLGGDRTNYWRGVADSVNGQPVLLDNGRTVKLTVSHPTFAQKVKGGTITAKRTKALTIPVTAEAYGQRASTLEHEKGINLFVIHQKGESAGFGLLAAKDASGHVTVHYLLRRSVTQRPDHRALPDQATFTLALLAAAEDYVDKINQGGSQP